MNSWNLGYMVGALIAGMFIPVQTGFNTILGRALQSPLHTSAAVFFAGFLTMCIFVLISRTPRPSFAAASSAPLISWVAGGALGVSYIAILVIAAPKLGAAATVAFVVAGQMICSAIIDHFGLLGFAEHAISLPRLLGLSLIAAGVVLVRLY
jgi:transporter family-2 protein